VPFQRLEKHGNVLPPTGQNKKAAGCPEAHGSTRIAALVNGIDTYRPGS
jgi:hypothetical protein